MLQGGDLFDAIAADIKYTEGVARDMVTDLANALQVSLRSGKGGMDMGWPRIVFHQCSAGTNTVYILYVFISSSVLSGLLGLLGCRFFRALRTTEEHQGGSCPCCSLLLLCKLPG